MRNLLLYFVFYNKTIKIKLQNMYFTKIHIASFLTLLKKGLIFFFCLRNKNSITKCNT